MTAREKARAAIGTLKYNGANLELALHWISLWRDDAPPKRAAFNANSAWQHDPAIMVCHVVREKSITCVESGAFIRTAVGFDLHDQDLLSIVPAGQRDERLAGAWKILQGAITVLYREFQSKDSPGGLAQGIALPFCDRPSEDSGYYLMHTNWRPVGDEWREGHVSVNLHSTMQRQLISFR